MHIFLSLQHITLWHPLSLFVFYARCMLKSGLFEAICSQNFVCNLELSFSSIFSKKTHENCMFPWFFTQKSILSAIRWYAEDSRNCANVTISYTNKVKTYYDISQTAINLNVILGISIEKYYRLSLRIKINTNLVEPRGEAKKDHSPSTFSFGSSNTAHWCYCKTSNIKSKESSNLNKSIHTGSSNLV